ncbi:hypothetical protein Poly51_01800 [Rubripirellula tenax]|uniref:HEAT repeat protein n=1 Tax=Rubripirellula tenax TaxID=2528015 RepID=A0A5C6FIK6_9BACT|nr:hypothetical protein [Rubripirellula tenax]TWU59907.1 hypothetical protein Poly51_01800 [Rubripirellula tenax]
MTIWFLDRPTSFIPRSIGRRTSRPRCIRQGLVWALLGSLGVALPCFGQDNPFGDPGAGMFGGAGLFGEPAVTTPAPSGDADDGQPVDLMNKQLLERAGRGNQDFAASVSSLARTGRWASVDQLLSGLDAKKLSGPQAAAMAATIGSDVFLRIKQSTEVSDAAKANLDVLGQASMALSTAPARLTQAIKGLDSNSRDTRLAASRTLLAGGDAAIGALAAAAVTQRTSESRDEILRVLVRMGDGGIAALRQLALYGADGVRGRAIASLARIDSKRFMADLLASLHAIDSNKEERNAAASGLTRLVSTLPSRSEALTLLVNDLRDTRAAATAIDNDDQVRTIWTIQPDRKSVASQDSRAILAAYRDAADAGVRLKRLAGDSQAEDAEILLSGLAYRVMIDPDWGTADSDEAFLDQCRPLVDSAAVLAAVDIATRPKLSSAEGYDTSESETAAVTETAGLIGLIRLVDALSDGLNRDDLVRSGGGRPTALVQQAWSSIPQVRYEAAALVSRLAGDGAYPGSSMVRKTLVEMTRLNDRPHAILVETRPAYSTHFEKLFDRLGWDATVVSSVSELQREIDRGGDLRMILSKVQLADLAPIEMVDIVRRAPRGGEAPIVFYDDDNQAGDSEGAAVALSQSRWTSSVDLIDPPVSRAGFDGLLNRIATRRRLPPLSVLDRQRFRQDAAEILRLAH